MLLLYETSRGTSKNSIDLKNILKIRLVVCMRWKLADYLVRVAPRGAFTPRIDGC